MATTRRIVNRTRLYSHKATKLYLDVPNSSSPIYSLNRQNDWKLRIYQEICDCNASGGKVVFFTATYDEEHLPHFRYASNTISIDIPCFEKKHYEKFMHDLRQFLKRKYKLVLPIKVIWPCEYGLDQNYSQRPHYHPLLFLPARLFDGNFEEFKNEHNLRKLIRSLWPYGFVYFSKKGKGGTFVTSDYAASYVSKYCFKSAEFYTREDVRDFLFFKDGHRNKYHFDLMRGKLPTHWQSRYFGIGLLDKFDDYDSYVNGFDFALKSDRNKGKAVKSRVPQYIERKLLYYMDDNKCYRLNDKGINWKVRRFLDSLPEKADKLRNSLTAFGLSKYISEEDAQRLQQKSISEISDYITAILGTRKIEEYILYKTVWRGLPADHEEIQALDDMDYDDFYSESVMQYSMQLMQHLNPTVYSSDGYWSRYSKQELRKFPLYDNCLRFSGFNEISKILDCIIDDCSQRKRIKYLDNLHRRKELVLSA